MVVIVLFVFGVVCNSVHRVHLLLVFVSYVHLQFSGELSCLETSLWLCFVEPLPSQPSCHKVRTLITQCFCD